MRKLASIVTIATSEPIPDTDKLDVTMMNGKGWRVVTGRNEFKPGDRAVYFEIDSALPADDERYGFLHERCLRKWKNKHNNLIDQCVRIRTIKLRGVISQGLIMPIDKFPELVSNEEGDDVTGLLNVRHFDEVAEAVSIQLARAKGPGCSCKREGNFPPWIPKTDEERIQNLADWPDKFKNTSWECTEKKDGSSCTFFWAASIRPDNPFGVCSRNFELKRDPENVWWEAAIKYDIENKLKRLGHDIAIQGELIGPGMNGNRDNLTEREFRVFRIWDITYQCYIHPRKRRELCMMLDLPHVPVIAEALPIFQLCPTVDDVLQFAEGKTENGNEREGLVFKAVMSSTGTSVSMSFKAVSNKYLLELK